MHRSRSFTPFCASRSPRVAAWLAVLITGALAWAQQTVPPTAPAAAKPLAPAEALDQKIIAGARSGSEGMTNLRYLSDMIGPRLTGSPALKRASDWTADRMRAYGLSDVHLEPWTIPIGWERGTAFARI